MKLHLIDLNEALVNLWAGAFAEFPEVSVTWGDLIAKAENCVVSPANSYGFMDGGIDAVYRDFFGPSIEQTVQEAISRRPERQLPVGASLIVRTGHERIPYMIVAPTMDMPERVESRNSYRAMRAVLRVAGVDAEVSRGVYCPGLATGVGMVPPSEAAAMMAEAYRDWKGAAKNIAP